MQRELPALLLCNGPVGSSGGGMCGKYYNSNEELDVDCRGNTVLDCTFYRERVENFQES